MVFVTPLSSPVSIGASELELDMLEDWDFERGNLDGIMRKAVELEQGRREQQRQRMVLYRRKKKDIMTTLHQERQRLEEVLKDRVTRMREAADTITIKTTRPMEESVHHVAIERAKLARENLALRQSVDDCQERRRAIERTYEEFRRHAQDEPQNIRLERDKGWYVHFPDNSPSFYFQPLSREELDDIKNLHASQVLVLQRHDFLAGDSSGEELGVAQSGSHCCVELEQLDYSCRVAVCNIPGDINLRYIAVLQHSRNKQADGKRVDTYSLTITDSKKNALIREAEGQQQNVQWILEGGCIATFTEVDDTTIDVVYDHWAGCLSEAHGHELYIDWVQHTVRLEQIISPTRMLRN